METLNSDQKPTFVHNTVLKKEAIDFLVGQQTCCPEGSEHFFIDATLGGGGHTRELLSRIPNCRVLGLDRDPAAINNATDTLIGEFGNRLQIVKTNFTNLEKALEKLQPEDASEDLQPCGILADLGTSQNQILYSSGFSIYRDRPLDMRMDTSQRAITAEDILRTASEDDLYKIFKFYGEEPFAGPIARKICWIRTRQSISTTSQLSKLVESVILPRKTPNTKTHVATRIFQALRIAVNGELSNLEKLLENGYRILRPNGRFVVISFHSLEDRIVKNFFRKSAEANLTTKICTRTPIVPSQAEIETNNCSRSAKLRTLEK